MVETLERLVISALFLLASLAFVTVAYSLIYFAVMLFGVVIGVLL